MGIVDFILNLAGLLLWLNWRVARFNPLNQRTPATLMGTLRPATAKKFRSWHLPVIIAGLLLLRALFYWQIGSATGSMTSYLNFGVAAPGFRRDIFSQALVFSFFSFGRMLGIFYLWLLLLSILNGPEPVHRFVKMQLGRVDHWRCGIKNLLPLIATAILWWLASWPLDWLQISPKPVSIAQRLEESLLIGLGSYLVWKFLIAALLALHLLNSYIYFGKHPFWNYVNVTAQKILLPLKPFPLRVGKADFAPVLGIVLVFLLASGVSRVLSWAYERVPF